MPHLYCDRHGQERKAAIVMQQNEYQREGETVLVVHGRLISGPWLCDRCNDELRKGDPAYLISAFPAHCHEDLYEYDFGYERAYFAMKKSDQATAYGAPWPDDSLRNRRKAIKAEPRHAQPLCALDLFPGGLPPEPGDKP
jgi:hypothetical protein